MKEITTNWTENEFKAYVLLYAAKTHSDIISEDEKEFLLSKVEPDTYKKIIAELKKDNDFDSLLKIQHNLRKFNYTAEDGGKLLKEINDLFFSEGYIDQVEKNFEIAISRILKKS